MKFYCRMLILVVFAAFAAGLPMPMAAASGADGTVMAMVQVDMSDCQNCSDTGECGPTGCSLVCGAGGFVTVPEIEAPDVRQARRILRSQLLDFTFSELHWLPLRNPPRPVL